MISERHLKDNQADIWFCSDSDWNGKISLLYFVGAHELWSLQEAGVKVNEADFILFIPSAAFGGIFKK